MGAVNRLSSRCFYFRVVVVWEDSLTDLHSKNASHRNSRSDGDVGLSELERLYPKKLDATHWPGILHIELVRSQKVGKEFTGESVSPFLWDT